MTHFLSYVLYPTAYKDASERLGEGDKSWDDMEEYDPTADAMTLFREFLGHVPQVREAHSHYQAHTNSSTSPGCLHSDGDQISGKHAWHAGFPELGPRCCEELRTICLQHDLSISVHHWAIIGRAGLLRDDEHTK